jgi:hypothetical protein
MQWAANLGEFVDAQGIKNITKWITPNNVSNREKVWNVKLHSFQQFKKLGGGEMQFDFWSLLEKCAVKSCGKSSSWIQAENYCQPHI